MAEHKQSDHIEEEIADHQSESSTIEPVDLEVKLSEGDLAGVRLPIVIGEIKVRMLLRLKLGVGVKE